MAALIVSDNILVLNFLVVEIVKNLHCSLIGLQHNDRFSLCLLVIHRYNHVLANDVIDLENYVLVDLPSYVAQNYNLCRG